MYHLDTLLCIDTNDRIIAMSIVPIKYCLPGHVTVPGIIPLSQKRLAEFWNTCNKTSRKKRRLLVTRCEGTSISVCRDPALCPAVSRASHDQGFDSWCVADQSVGGSLGLDPGLGPCPCLCPHRCRLLTSGPGIPGCRESFYAGAEAHHRGRRVCTCRR